MPQKSLLGERQIGVARLPRTAANQFRIDSEARTARLRDGPLPKSYGLPDCVLPVATSQGLPCRPRILRDVWSSSSGAKTAMIASRAVSSFSSGRNHWCPAASLTKNLDASQTRSVPSHMYLDLRMSTRPFDGDGRS